MPVGSGSPQWSSLICFLESIFLTVPFPWQISWLQERNPPQRSVTPPNNTCIPWHCAVVERSSKDTLPWIIPRSDCIAWFVKNVDLSLSVYVESKYVPFLVGGPQSKGALMASFTEDINAKHALEERTSPATLSAIYRNRSILAVCLYACERSLLHRAIRLCMYVS